MKKKLILAILLFGIISVVMMTPIHADPIPNVNIQVGNEGSSSGTSSISILLLVTVLSIAPAFLVLMTSFTRIVIVLGFVRTSLGTQNMPPNTGAGRACSVSDPVHYVTNAGHSE